MLLYVAEQLNKLFPICLTVLNGIVRTICTYDSHAKKNKSASASAQLLLNVSN